jgi:hypothetical protein
MLYIQYQNAPYWERLLYGDSEVPYKGINSYVNIEYRDYYKDYFNIYTASGDALDNWGIILNTSRNIQSLKLDTSKTLKFNKNTTPITNFKPAFNHGSFAPLSSVGYVSLDDNQYRCLLLMRYQTFTSNMSILSITDILNTYFSNLNKYGYPNTQVVSVNDNFTSPTAGIIIYGFSQPLDTIESTIFTKPDSHTYYLPVPLGVTAVIAH